MKHILYIIITLVAKVVYAETFVNKVFSSEGLTGFGVITSAVGVNHEKNLITGFNNIKNLSMPGRSFHANCRIVFSGVYSNERVLKVQVVNATKELSKPTNGQLIFDGTSHNSPGKIIEQNFRIKLENDLPGYPKESMEADGEIEFSTNKPGAWNQVSAIRTPKARFHRDPDDSSATKSLLVAGDVIYIYNENPGWYYVKFQGIKRETTGWIKRSDTIQLDPKR